MHLKVKKILFVGAIKDKELFYKQAQEAGVVHFEGVRLSEHPEIPIMQAIQVLMGLPSVKQEELSDFEEAEAITQKINTDKKAIDECTEELRVLDLEIERQYSFGDFSLEDIEYIEKQTGKKFRFFAVKSAQDGSLELDFPGFFFVAEEFDLRFYLCLDEGVEEYPDMVEFKVERSLSTLVREREQVLKRMHALEHELKHYARYSRFLHEAFYFYLNDYNLNQVQGASTPLLEENLFSSYGWVPANKLEEVVKIGEELGIYVQQVAIEETDTVPTYLENEGLAQAGEALVRIYDTPGPNDKDPSIWVLCFFSLFFSMIIADAGYGLIFLLLAIYLWKRLAPLNRLKKRLLTLMTVLSSSCIIWGVLTHSYFGVEIGLDSPLRKVSVLHWLAEKKVDYILHHKEATYKEWVREYPQIAEAKVPDDVLSVTKKKSDGTLEPALLHDLSSSILMEFAIFIGLVHVCCSFGRYLYRNWRGFGWIPAMIGAYLYFPHYVGALTFSQYVFGLPPQVGAVEGLYLMSGGIFLAVTLSIIQHGWIGIMEIMAPIQIFSDVMSYLRLFALGLAALILAETINGMIGGMPFVIALLLVAFSHVVNMGLGIMAGTIHGLRLNFLEWYHYSFDGGGRDFKPLKIMKME